MHQEMRIIANTLLDPGFAFRAVDRLYGSLTFIRLSASTERFANVQSWRLGFSTLENAIRARIC